MNNYDDALNYINEQEKLPIDYCKIGDNSKKLIVSFASFGKNYYDRKSSLLKLKYERNDFDILYIKKPRTWYLGGIRGIGKNVNHTIAFLRKEFTKYDKVVCVGISMGGYAAILFGSLLNVDYVIVNRPQTDLDFVINNCMPARDESKVYHDKCKAHNLYDASLGLSKIIDFKSFEKYKNLNKFINNSTIYYVKGHGYGDTHGWHSIHHYNNIKNFKNVVSKGMELDDNITPLLTDILDK
jgi:hypothetical protein